MHSGKGTRLGFVISRLTAPDTGSEDIIPRRSTLELFLDVHFPSLLGPIKKGENETESDDEPSPTRKMFRGRGFSMGDEGIKISRQERLQDRKTPLNKETTP